MKTDQTSTLDLEIQPLSPERWQDLEALFGPRGAVAGCWCMWWRLPRKEYHAQSGDGNRMALRQITETGRAPGLLAYHAGKPVGWVAIAPRSEYPALKRSRILQPVDDLPVWSVTCFFIARGYRRRGVMQSLIDGAVSFALTHGAQVVEAYPTEAREDNAPAAFVFTGLAEAFRRAGFEEVARRSQTRPIMRWVAQAGAAGQASQPTGEE